MSDGAGHRVELWAELQSLSLRVDGGALRTVANDGGAVASTEPRPLFVGGVAREVAAHATQMWHLRNATSLRGGWALEYCRNIVLICLCFF